MSAGAHQFVVSVSGGIGSSADWGRALQADAVSGTSALRAQAEEWLKARGQALGEEVSGIVESLGAGYVLEAVSWDGSASRWLIRVRNPRTLTEVPLPAELVDGAIGAASINDLDRLRNLVLFAAGRTDLIFRRKA